jgi:putative glutamine amidotransferase
MNAEHQRDGAPLASRRRGRRAPIIAVTGPDRRRWLLWAFNALALRRARGRPVAVTPGRRPADLRHIDGLVIVGGADVDPALYGQPNLHARKIDPPRDQLELELIRWAVDHGKPLLGICRGAQLLNVALGGTLHQEASLVYPGFRPSAGLYQQLARRRPIRVIAGGWTSSLLPRGRVHLVNSLHHQAIAEVAAPLEVTADDEFGMVQAVELRDKGRFVVGVQWHPELMPRSPAQRALFAALVRAAGKRHGEG